MFIYDNKAVFEGFVLFFVYNDSCMSVNYKTRSGETVDRHRSCMLQSA